MAVPHARRRSCPSEWWRMPQGEPFYPTVPSRTWGPTAQQSYEISGLKDVTTSLLAVDVNENVFKIVDSAPSFSSLSI
jgi:hypothetical protein